MARAVETNLAMIRHIAKRFGHLRDRVVFLGGAATVLLITDPATPDVRVTTDVDVIVEVTSLVDYYKDFLSCTFKEFLQHRDFLEALPGHLFPDPASQQWIPLLLERARNIAGAMS